MTDEAPCKEMAKHAKNLWFDDGNVVFASGSFKYRVYRGILTQQSTVFKEMFAATRSPDEPTYDGCPLIHVEDDPLDFMYMLSAIFIRSYIDKLALPGAPEVCAGIVELAHKYRCDSLRADAIRRLESIYPITFEALQQDPTFASDKYHATPYSRTACLINVARRIVLPELDRLLPIAFYLCSQLDGGELVHGVPRMDGSIARLSPDDLVRCINGKAKLCMAVHDELSMLLPKWNNVSEGCASPENCKDAMTCLEDAAHGQRLFSPFDALTNLNPWIDRALSEEKVQMCYSCIIHTKSSQAKRRIDCWAHLQGFFKLNGEETE